MPAPYRPHNDLWTFVRQLRRDVDKLLRRGQASKVPFEIKVFADDTDVETGDDKFVFAMPYDCDGLQLRYAQAYVTTVSSSGLPTVQIRNRTAAVDMLSTRITIDVSEFTSMTAATPPVVNAANAGVSFGDMLAIDVDVAGTGTKGLGVILGFTL